MVSQPSCKEFADPHVQHDTTTLLLDLILLKRDVYRHLLFNRGTGARMVYDAVGAKNSPSKEKEDDSKVQQSLAEYDREIVSFPFPLPTNFGLTAHVGKVEIDCKTWCSLDLG